MTIEQVYETLLATAENFGIKKMEEGEALKNIEEVVKQKLQQDYNLVADLIAKEYGGTGEEIIQEILESAILTIEAKYE